MGDLQGLMVFICILSKHGSRPAPSTQYMPPQSRPAPQLSPSSLHFSTSEFQLKLSSRAVYIFQPTFYIFYLRLEDDLRCSACGTKDSLNWEDYFSFLDTHSHPPHLIFPEFSQDRIGSSESSLNSWGS